MYRPVHANPGTKRRAAKLRLFGREARYTISRYLTQIDGRTMLGRIVAIGMLIGVAVSLRLRS